jgi:hypothetical protein
MSHLDGIEFGDDQFNPAEYIPAGQNYYAGPFDEDAVSPAFGERRYRTPGPVYNWAAAQATQATRRGGYCERPGVCGVEPVAGGGVGMVGGVPHIMSSGEPPILPPAPPSWWSTGVRAVSNALGSSTRPGIDRYVRATHDEALLRRMAQNAADQRDAAMRASFENAANRWGEDAGIRVGWGLARDTYSVGPNTPLDYAYRNPRVTMYGPGCNQWDYPSMLQLPVAGNTLTGPNGTRYTGQGVYDPLYETFGGGPPAWPDRPPNAPNAWLPPGAPFRVADGNGFPYNIPHSGSPLAVTMAGESGGIFGYPWRKNTESCVGGPSDAGIVVDQQSLMIFVLFIAIIVCAMTAYATSAMCVKRFTKLLRSGVRPLA